MATRRTRKKAMKRAQQWLPGVPAMHEGGFVHNLTEHGGPSPFGDPIIPGGAPIPAGSPIQQNVTQQSGINTQALIAAGWSQIGPGLWLTDRGQVVSEADLLNPPAAPGGGGSATPQFRPGELEFLQEQFAFEQESFQLDLELRQLTQKHSNEIARGQLQLAQQTEARIAEIQRRQQQLEASLGRAQGIAGLASSRGNIELQRSQELARLLANPRDTIQSSIAQGGGQSFLGNLLNQQAIGGQSSALIGDTPLLGAQFQQALQSITQRPDIPLFEEAADLFRNVPQFAKGGTHMVTDEPVIGIGAITGLPKFTLGEPAPGFPDGKPEKLQVTPLQEGGSVKTTAGTGAFNPFSPGTTAESLLSRATGGAAKPPAPPAAPAQTPFTFPTFPGISQLLDFLFQGSGLQQAQQGGAGAIELGQQVQNFQQSIPRTPGEAIRRLMAGLPQQQLASLLPSQVGLLESVVSSLGVPPEDFFASLMRGFPTGPNPNAVSFGNF